MNYDEMPAGREMDALIAGKVMGLETEWLCTSRGEDLLYYDNDRFLCHVAHYSTDISAAWEVVEKMRKEFCCLSVYSDHDYVWEVTGIKADAGSYEKHDEKLLGAAPTAPLAICRAALKAVETSCSPK